MNSIYQTALAYTAAGCSLIPIKLDGSKQPCVEWKPYQHHRPTVEEIDGWYKSGATRGIGLICGAVSGNLETLDIDAPELIEPLFALIAELAPNLLAKLVIVETPRGGRHLLYKCDEIAGNQKLALREVELGEIADEEAKQQKAYRRKSDGKWCKTFTLVETRGEGGYIVAPGSPARCHPTGREYRLLQGDFSAVPTITPQERAIILDCARSFNEHLQESQEPRLPSLNNGLKPGADFNERGDVESLLQKHGWQSCGQSRAGTRWMRPGGDRPSATLFNESRKLYVFSTNAAPLDFDRAYSPFALLATLEHNGDLKAAAKALAQQGYGEPAKPKETKQTNQPVKARIGDVTYTVVEDGDRPGVYATDADGNRDFVCSRLHVEADTRDEHNENWGRLLKFPDRDSVWHQWAMPMSLLSGDGREYRERLLELGLEIDSKRKARTLLETYLNTNPNKKALCVTKQGWHRGAFVLPDETIGENGEPIYLQTLSTNHLFRQAGTLDEWRERIGQYCAGNTRLVLAASVAFAAPLLEPLQGENGGWHFTGGSSKGKTTALYVAGSIHGGGGDKGYIRRWRATINGLESVAETHHDALLCLDEIAECRPDDVNEAAYMLANGQGKARQARAGGLRRTLEWRLLFLSSGELSIADHVAQTGKRVRAGQEVRVINLPADAEKGLGLFETIHDFSTPDEFARHLQRAARDTYGTPIRVFLRAVAGNQDELRKRYRIFEAALLDEMLPKAAASEVARVAHRFALVAFAGELATEQDITGWQPDEATAAAKTLFAAWLDSRGTPGSTDEESAIRQVRAFLEAHGSSRFQKLDSLSEERIINNRAGYLKFNDAGEGEITEYRILPEVFRREVCAGYDHKNVLKWLEARGWLALDGARKDRLFRTPDGRARAYFVKSEIMGS